jgi:hypothetical protein
MARRVTPARLGVNSRTYREGEVKPKPWYGVETKWSPNKHRHEHEEKDGRNNSTAQHTTAAQHIPR